MNELSATFKCLIGSSQGEAHRSCIKTEQVAEVVPYLDLSSSKFQRTSCELRVLEGKRSGVFGLLCQQYTRLQSLKQANLEGLPLTSVTPLS